MASADRIRLALPFDRAALARLEAGDSCLLTGPLYTLRDAGHVRLLAELEAAGGALPYGLDGQAIFYAGPTPEAAGRPFGAVGPTTASRMDFAAPALHRAGVAATVGKGRRSSEVRDACRATGSVYFVACGGAAAYLAKCVASSETVAYDDLGTEALDVYKRQALHHAGHGRLVHEFSDGGAVHRGEARPAHHALAVRAHGPGGHVGRRAAQLLAHRERQTRGVQHLSLIHI